MKRFSLVAARQFGQKVGAKVMANAMLGAASFQTKGATLSKWDQRIFGALFVSAAIAHQANAQSASVQTTVDTVKSTVFTVAQGIFAIFLVIALVKTAKKFMSGEPDAMTSLMWLLGGVLIFFGFSALKTTLVGSGQAGNGTADGLLGQ